jgi:16S rRNA (cytosine967-C5)-methyltransferase
LLAVRDGQSMTPALEDVDAQLRPGVQALAFHALRWLGRAEALRQQLAKRPPPPEADALLCVALALACAEEAAPYTAHTLVDQAVEAAKRSDATLHQASFINGCLRRFLRERDALMALTEKSPQAVWNHPQWWIDRVKKDHPTQWQDILRANNSRAPLILRINEKKTAPAQYIQALLAMDIGAFPIGEHGVVLTEARPVMSLPGFAEGHFSVQDAAAQLAAPLLLDGLTAPGDGRLNILDACAAPGGKTAHLLELADCDVTALDIDARRCERIAQNLARLGLQAHIVVGDGTAGRMTASCLTRRAPPRASCAAIPTCAGCAGRPTLPSWRPSRPDCWPRSGRCSSPAAGWCIAPARCSGRKASSSRRRSPRTMWTRCCCLRLGICCRRAVSRAPYSLTI